MSQYGFLELASVSRASVCLGNVQEKKDCGKQWYEFMSKQFMQCPFRFLSFLTHKQAEIFHMSSKRLMLYVALPVKCNENIHTTSWFRACRHHVHITHSLSYNTFYIHNRFNMLEVKALLHVMQLMARMHHICMASPPPPRKKMSHAHILHE